jgi:phage tail sheath protein FI
MSFSVSPGVVVNELALSTVIPAISTSIGGFVGIFEWGPVEQITLVGSETELASSFATPSAATIATDYLTASAFLAYSNSLKVVRVVETITDVGTGTVAAVNANSAGVDTVLVKNQEQYDDGVALLTAGGAFVGRFVGAIGNSLEVTVLDSTNFAQVGLETKAALFDDAPVGDEVHVVVIDTTGLFSGVANSVVETWSFLQVTSGAKKADGSNNYFYDVINAGSSYVYVGDVSLAVAGEFVLTAGSSGSDTVDDDILLGWDLFSDEELVDVSLLVVGNRSASTAQYITQNIAEVRKDCVAFISPLKSDVVGATTILANVLAFRASLNLNSSYAFVDSGWKYTYNKHADRFEWIPLCGDIAGLCARTDANRAPWFSPAGYNRGNIKNVVKLAWTPNRPQRNSLYKLGVNPVINSPGIGPVLFGDKTALSRPSAFDRINVRRLFIVLEKSISLSSRFSLFDNNTQFTRAQFVSSVEPFLREIKARGGIYDFRVVCDETNNTGQVLDTNQFIGDIYIKPAKSINYITLNFIAVRSGVEFSEVVGQA